MGRYSSAASPRRYALIYMLFTFYWTINFVSVAAQTSTASLSETPTITVNTSAPNPTPGNTTNLDALWDCQPCGQYICSFSANAVLASETYTILIAVPIFNCYPNATTTFDWPIQGEANITESWTSIDGGIGLNIGMLQLETPVGWSRNRGINISELAILHVPPGMKGALVAHVQYNRLKGNMTFSLPQTSTRHSDGGRKEMTVVNDIVLNQPYSLLGYDKELVPCGSAFTANESQPFACMRQNGSSKVIVQSPIPLLLSFLFVCLWSIC